MPEVTESKGVVSLFSGAGGLDAGLEQAGFTTLLAIDNDPDSVATLAAAKKRRLPVDANRCYLQDATIVEADLTKLTKAKLLELWGQDTAPAVLAGGPPCQSFSSAGRMRGIEDERGRLFLDFVRAARALKPEFVVFENVQGLVTARDSDGNVGGVLTLVRDAFEKAGYACSFALVNAADYGTPQRRVRLVMVGSRRHPLPGFPPAPTHSREGGNGSLLTPWVSLREALADVAEPTGADVVRPGDALAAKLAEVGPGSGIRVGGRVENNRPGGHWGYRQDGFVADWDQPSRTIRSATTPDWLRLEDGSHRRLTWWECARLQGFPEEWAFQGTVTSRFRQVGNAVPVQLAHALGGAVAAALDAGPLPRGIKPQSAEWPASFRRRIRYTKAEQRVNGPLRRRREDAAPSPMAA
ncbi:MAG TPA: DNA cytosine methyltransferase [Solirubrobacteraceae bacterium]|nr:DNA cytosine methyltransferase [Solirubrobacteraceae bacterium]